MPERHPDSGKEEEGIAVDVSYFVRAQFAQCKLDIEVLKQECKDTLAGVARHIRDLSLNDRPFYFARFDVVVKPERVCSELLPVINQIGGPCVVVKNLARTSCIKTRGSEGSLPIDRMRNPGKLNL